MGDIESVESTRLNRVVSTEAVEGVCGLGDFNEVTPFQHTIPCALFNSIEETVAREGAIVPRLNEVEVATEDSVSGGGDVFANKGELSAASNARARGEVAVGDGEREEITELGDEEGDEDVAKDERVRGGGGENMILFLDTR